MILKLIGLVVIIIIALVILIRGIAYLVVSVSFSGRSVILPWIFILAGAGLFWYGCSHINISIK